MTEFERVEFDTGRLNNDGSVRTYAMYQIEGIDRNLSIGELVMAICLDRATELERKIIRKMEESARTTEKLENLTKVQTALVNAQADGVTSLSSSFDALNRLLPDDQKFSQPYPDSNWMRYLSDSGQLGISISVDTGKSSYSYDELTEIITDISNAMDSLNSLGQEDMLELQSLTNKRDEAYNLCSNMLKSINSVLIGNANNI